MAARLNKRERNDTGVEIAWVVGESSQRDLKTNEIGALEQRALAVRRNELPTGIVRTARTLANQPELVINATTCAWYRSPGRARPGGSELSQVRMRWVESPRHVDHSFPVEGDASARP